MNDKDLTDKLRAEKFDLAIGEPYSICPFGKYEIRRWKMMSFGIIY